MSYLYAFKNLSHKSNLNVRFDEHFYWIAGIRIQNVAPYFLVRKQFNPEFNEEL